jgi:Holliday junction DNA helicase RuvB
MSVHSAFRFIVGQQRNVALLDRQLRGAQARGEPFPPTLMIGPSGVGKTLLAHALAKATGTTFHLANGDETVAGLLGRITAMQAGDVMFIDEAHMLGGREQELLYGVIDRYCMTVSGVEHSVQPCTLVLATDQPGKLHNALQKRMAVTITLTYYSTREMRQIINRLLADMGMLMSPQGANMLAGICFGVPRRAQHHLNNLRRHYAELNTQQFGITEVRKYLDDSGFDANGLNSASQRYLRVLAVQERASIETLALAIGSDATYVRQQIEPILVQAGYVSISSGGRRLTAAGTKLTLNAIEDDNL